MKKILYMLCGMLACGTLMCGCGEEKTEIQMNQDLTETSPQSNTDEQDNAGDDSSKTAAVADIANEDENKTNSTAEEKEMSDEEIERAAVDILTDLDNYRIALLFEHAYNELEEPGSEYVVDFDDAQITQAAGYSKSVKHDEPYAIGEGTAAYHIDKNSMDEVCKDIFGRLPDYSTLKDSTVAGEGIFLYYGTPMMKFFDMETDTDSEVLEVGAYAEEGNIAATQYVYHGHWSGTESGESNFEIDYTFEKNSESKYGIVLKKMVIYHQEEMWDGYKAYSAPCMAMPEEGFYGVWVAASKDKDEAEDIASGMIGKGMDAIVLLTSDWENLNSDPVYVITIGYYTDETEAKNELVVMKSVGYKDAYVKHSGKRK